MKRTTIDLAIKLLPLTERILSTSEGRDEVKRKFQRFFLNPKILSSKKFEHFLSIKGNRHWTNLERNKRNLLLNFRRTKEAITILVDETRPIVARVDEALAMVKGFGPALATAILHVAYPDRYGVWNGKSKERMEYHSVLPALSGSEGEKYKKVNKVLLSLSDRYKIDLWKLDSVWEIKPKEIEEEIELEQYRSTLNLPGRPMMIAGMEGGRRSVTVTRTERNPANRKACLSHWGYKCRVCGFDFGKIFGDAAKDYIHVHHHNLVAAAGEIVPDPINDMSPLCPNCHAVSHLKRPPYSIDELKEMRTASSQRR